MTFSAPVGEPPAVQFIAPAKLKVDAAYQRSLDGRASKKLVAAIADRWDWRLCVPLLVAARGSDLFIIDGQHRWAAAQRRGDIPFLPCAIGQYESAAEEAALFVAANKRRVAVNRLDLYRAAVAGGDEASTTIDALLAGANLSIAEHTSIAGLKPNQIGTTAVLYKALKERGAKRLGHVIAMIGSAFGGQVISYSGVIIGALVQLDPAKMDEANRARLLATLSRRTADEWATIPEVYRARGGAVRATQLFFAIRDAMTKAAPAGLDRAERPAATVEVRQPRPLATCERNGQSLPTGPTWCDQCEQRVSQAVARACTSPFCKAKGNAAA